MLKSGALAAILTICAPLAALSQSHTPEDEAACTPDVLRLCQHFIPKRADIIACLTERKNELSPPCYLVFSRPPKRAEEERKRRKPVGQSTHH